MAVYSGLFDVVVHWRDTAFYDQIAMSTKISSHACVDLLEACLENAGAPTGDFTGICDGKRFDSETAAEVLRTKVTAIMDSGTLCPTIHLYPESKVFLDQ